MSEKATNANIKPLKDDSNGHGFRIFLSLSRLP